MSRGTDFETSAKDPPLGELLISKQMYSAKLYRSYKTRSDVIRAGKNLRFLKEVFRFFRF